MFFNFLFAILLRCLDGLVVTNLEYFNKKNTLWDENLKLLMPVIFICAFLWHRHTSTKKGRRLFCAPCSYILRLIVSDALSYTQFRA